MSFPPRPLEPRRLRAVHGRAAATTSQPLATAAAMDVLQRGGNAFDAAITAAAMLAVVEPTANGLGGDHVALCFRAGTSAPTAVLGVGRAPAALPADTLPQLLSATSPHAVAVPGAVAAWFDIKHLFGSTDEQFTMQRLLQPAVRAARDGFFVHPTCANDWRLQEPLLRAVDSDHPLLIAAAAAELRHAPRPGERFVNADLAAVLTDLGTHGASAFYDGRIAAAIVDALAAHGGVMTRDDLRTHRSIVDDALEVSYRGWRVFGSGVPTHGAVALMALKMLERFDLRSDAMSDADRMHVMVEAIRIAYAEAMQRVGDGDIAADAVRHMTRDDFCEQAASKIDPTERKDVFSDRDMVTLAGGGTVQFCVVDAQGNMVSAVQSNYIGFGTGIVPAGCGFTLQNRGLNFATGDGSVNFAAGGRRPYHTIMPGLMVRQRETAGGGDGDNSSSPEAVAFGVMGSFMQPQGHVIVVTGIVDHGLDAQEALSARRFRVTGPFSAIEEAFSKEGVLVETGAEEELIEQLRRRGHDITVCDALSPFGRGHVCVRDTDGRVTAGADPRADGVAMVWL